MSRQPSDARECAKQVQATLDQLKGVLKRFSALDSSQKDLIEQMDKQHKGLTERFVKLVMMEFNDVSSREEWVKAYETLHRAFGFEFDDQSWTA